MTDNEIKEACLQEAGIDLGRYSYNELNEIKDALRRYHNTKLKLGQSEQLLAFFRWYCNYKNNIHEGSEEEIINEWLDTIENL